MPEPKISALITGKALGIATLQQRQEEDELKSRPKQSVMAYTANEEHYKQIKKSGRSSKKGNKRDSNTSASEHLTRSLSIRSALKTRVSNFSKTTIDSDSGTEIDIEDLDSDELTESEYMIRERRRRLRAEYEEGQRRITIRTPFTFLANNDFFNNFMLVIIMANCFMMLLEGLKTLDKDSYERKSHQMISGVDDVRTYLSCPCNRRYLIHTLNVFFFFSYSIEFIIMTIGLGLKEYSKGWGLFDFLMLVFMILELVDVDTTDCRDFYNYRRVTID